MTALALANERDVPVVALKVGREERTRELVAAHSGALAGEDGAYEALFDAYGVSRVESLDEMGDTLALFAAGRRAGPGGLASVHDSGGERALMVDAAAAVGVPFAEISDETSARMEALLDPGLPPVNPLDFWGTGRDAHEIVTGCVRALLEDPEVAALAFAVDLTSEEYPDMGYIAMARETFPETDKPYAMLSNFSSGIDRGDAKLLDGDGIPVLEGTLTGLAAFKHLFAYRDSARARRSAVASPVTDEVRERWIERLSSGEPFDELEGLALLADYGVPVVESVRAETLEDAIAAAERIGFPVAVKTAAPGVQHKSDVGGVRLGRRRLALARGRVRGSRTPARSAGHGRADGAGGGRDRARDRARSAVRAAGARRRRRRARRGAEGPSPRDAAARRGPGALDGRPTGGASVARRGSRPARGRRRCAHEGDRRAVVARARPRRAPRGARREPVICGPNGCVAVDALVIPRRGRYSVDRAVRGGGGSAGIPAS